MTNQIHTPDAAPRYRLVGLKRRAKRNYNGTILQCRNWTTTIESVGTHCTDINLTLNEGAVLLLE